ncbi:FabD/lysophospholipase-like protein [Acaromyces ingoldii]|uniref:FabD/lysophospholipase-like protein n=1 Tax=Acaromyces ingoldii TaxID=215250 RepID=A0A316YCZ1_9BASI|nr:FabD/lysophospholipase-like protein [Acaromyces ingoldii]PWN86714.1 FabD/lysophospholipase-like protein [Acaromyces ingoldii]
MASTLARRARQNPWATCAVGHSIVRALKRAGRPRPWAEASPAFLFPDQGPQHLHMGRALFGRFSTFREWVLRSDRVYRDVVGWSLIEDDGLFGVQRGALWEANSRWSTLHILPALTVVQVGLVDLLRSLGLRPQAMLAHSAGETAMTYVVAVRLSVIRAGLMPQTEAEGAGMIAVACSSRRASKLMHALSLSLDIAAINGPEAVTLAGKRVILDSFRAQAVAQDVQCTMLRTNVAVHSSFMEPLRERLVAQVKELFAAHGLDKGQIRHQASIDVFSSTVREDAFHGPFDCDFW